MNASTISAGRSWHARNRRLRLAAMVALFVAMAISPHHVTAGSATSPLDCVQVTGTFIDAMGATGTFQGCFVGQQLVLASGQIALLGALSIELSDRAGRSFATLDGMATLPVRHIDASSGKLNVSLAPGHVAVVGLQAYVEPIDMELPATAIAPTSQPLADAGWTCGLPES